MGSELCVKRLESLAVDTRWRIVGELVVKPMTVNELTAQIGANQYNVSKHLRILRKAGIVEAEKTGIHVECSIAEALRQKPPKGPADLDLGCCTFRFERSPKASE
ncbi:MAG TPA: metalloregulator ArsR/SmtB family transcription factor [Verrucomicrobiota bacterium]|nr:ArsR family transcriptional regulator [Verrucomicrobiales bacterium]HRI15447.1 metalloregulator ArsR/SmtB family transcription factor [Verrucomicrobiota bacterium]